MRVVLCTVLEGRTQQLLHRSWKGESSSAPTAGAGFYNRETLDTGVAHNACFAGDPSDLPIGGDWDGDGDGNLGIYRPSDQKFFLFTKSCVGLAPPSDPFANAMGAAEIEVALPVAGADVTQLVPVAGTFGLG